MAIYHFSAQVLSRGKGQSAVAAAAYRSGDKLQDERTGEEKFYRREVTPDSMILAPSNSPEWMKDRERLWNAVEKAENRKDSQLAREINIALPVELSNGQQKELIRDFVQKEFVDKGMIADICIHRDDSNNPHAHVMLTTREIMSDGFGKKNRDWNNKELLNQWREEWSNHANKSLEREGVQERISHLSHEARGLEQLPTVHLGHVANEMEKRGVETPQGDINRDRQEYNSLVVDLQKYREEKQAIEAERARQFEQGSKVKSVPEHSSSEELVDKFIAKFLTGKKEEVVQQSNVETEQVRQPEQVTEVKPKQPSTQLSQEEFIERLRREFEENARKEKEQQRKVEQKKQRFNTPAEHDDLQIARTYLKADPSLPKIAERRQQIDKSSERLSNGKQFLLWKSQTINEAASQYKSIAHNQGRIQEQLQKIEQINWLNPLKFKDNRTIKEHAEGVISDCLNQINGLEEKLNYHREKLGFETEIEFKQVQAKSETERPGLIETNRSQRQQIAREIDALSNAENALKNGFVRQVAFNYPERSEMQYMSYETAHKLNEVNKKNGKIVPVEATEKFVTNKHQEIKQLKDKVSYTEQYSSRLHRAENYLKDYEKYRDIVENYKNKNSFSKMFVSKSTKNEYEKAVIARDSYENYMKREGITGRTDFEKQSKTYEDMQVRIPEFNGLIKTALNGLGILDAIVKGIEQAGREQERSTRQQQLQRGKGKGKKRENRWDMER
ncbi:hypothetical protein FQ087_21845 [Sporosarcina sp. ANT_H38]|uniref:MobQ family relaxase n=1 Tax=unclassified Sporosarcina TaxID=2647733 RepID=UPI0011F2066E|nr:MULTISPECIES: MobQ family relaxase [unclassified Sporosarcina]KAA0940632.1 hypothetical protein FQ087_21845 [Sporosarcina sp. ANT_H38]QJS06568.1 mobilization protein AL [Sporosarcina sp.]